MKQILTLALLCSFGFPLLNGVHGQESNVSTSAPLVDKSDKNLEFMFDGTTPTTVDQLREMETHLASLFERVKPATVNVRVGMGQGTGVVVTRDGFILTAAHVIGRPGEPAVITFPDGKTVSAITLGTNSSMDSGMVKITDKGKWPYLDLGESESLSQGQWVAAIGHPGGIDPDRGLVLRVGRIILNANDEGILRTDCTLVGGDSGGPLVDMDGNLIGIHSRIGQRLTDNVHVPIDQFSNGWDDLAFGDPYLGLRVKGTTTTVERITRSSERRRSPAHEAEFKIGDVILEIDGKEVSDNKDIGDALKKYEPGDQVEFLVKRKLKKTISKADEKPDDDKDTEEPKDDSKEPQPEFEELTLKVTIGWR